MAEPRPLTEAERHLLTSLVRHSRSSALAAQTNSAVVAGTCACGCPSVRLRTDGAALPGAVVAALGQSGRADYLRISAQAGATTSGPVQVTVHVLNGLLEELEVYAGDGVAVELSPATALVGLDIG